MSSSDQNQHRDNGKPTAARSTARRGLTHRALGGMLWTFSGSGVQLLVQLGTIMALGRLLTPTEFGLMGAAAVVVALSQIVSQIGVGPAIIQRRELRPTHIRVAITLSCTLGILLGAVVWFGAPALAEFYRMPEVEPVLRAVAFLFPLDGLNTVGKSLLTRELRFRLFVGLELAAYTVGYALVGILLAWLGYGVWALVIANLSQVGLRAIAMYFAVRHPLRPSLDRQAATDLLGFGLGHSMAQIGAALSQQGDNLVVGRWLGPEALGIYGRAYSLMVMPATAFGKIVNRVLFPVMSQVQNERKRLANAYERASAIVALISLPLSAFLWVLAPEFIAVMLGPSWGAVVLPFRLFTISLLFRTSSRISDVCTKAAGEVYWRALVQWAYAAMVVTAAVVGQRWGVGGVAIGVSIAMAINWLNMAQLSRRVTGLPWSRLASAHVPPVVLALLVGIVALPASQLARAAHLGSLPTLILAAVAVGAIAVIASMLRPELFLGQHGAWAEQRGEELLRRRWVPTPAARAEAEKLASTERLASVVEGDPK